MEPSPLISVVITCFSEGPFLAEAVQSVLGQTWLNRECIVVNDASKDEATNTACDMLEGRQGITVMRNAQNLGSSGARNVGIRKARGGIIQCLDGDDRLPPTCLEIVAEGFSRHPAADFIYGDILEFGARNEAHQPGPLTLEDLLLKQSIDGHSPFRRRVWEAVGGFDEHMRENEDWEFWLNIFASGAQGTYVPETLYEWRIHPGNKHTHYVGRWPEICAYMYRKHQAVYDRFGKGPDLLAWAWRSAALHHYSREETEQARKCAREALSLTPDDRQMAGLRFRCSLPAGVLATARAVRRLARKAFTHSSPTS